ncbi:hypothetical protein MRB53_041905 [Persea americana]|nr:hypothetical protein MRB53_041905 [Persea americana]
MAEQAVSYGRMQRNPPFSSPLLVLFNVINQSFFMSMFFYLSGQNTAVAARRKTRKQSLARSCGGWGCRLCCIHLSARRYTWAWYNCIEGVKVTPKFAWDCWRALRGIRGPVWYTGLLLVFDLVYVAVRPQVQTSSRAERSMSKTAVPSPRLDETANSTVRGSTGFKYTSSDDGDLRRSDDHICELHHLSQHLDLLTTSCGGDTLPQCSASISAGVRTCLHGRSPRKHASLNPPEQEHDGRGLPVATIAAVYSTYLLNTRRSVITEAFTGGNALAAAYAIGNDFGGYLLGSAVLLGFKRFANFEIGKGWFAKGAYPAFLCHYPVFVLLGTWTEKWKAEGVVKTVWSAPGL